MKNRTEQASKNVAYALLNKIIIILLEFISRYFFIYYLGSELLGVNGVFTNIIQCLSLAELGMNNVVMYSYYRPLSEHNTIKLAALNSFYRIIYNIIAASVTVLGLLLVPFLPYIINTSYKIPYLTYIYFLFLADTIVSYLCIYKVTILTADQNSYIVTKYDMGINTARTFLQIVVLICFKSFSLYLTVKIIFSIIGNVLKANRANNTYSFITKKAHLNDNEKKEIFSTIKSGFIYKLSVVLLNSTDNILISAIVGTVWVGLLSNYIILCTTVSSFISIAFNNLTASIGNLVTTETAEKKLNIFSIMTFSSAWIGAVCFICTLVLCDEFISLWLGDKYVLDFSIVLPKIMMLYFSCIMQPIFSYREALGLYTKTKFVMLLSAIINIILSIIMGFYMGTAGILIASLIAVVSTYFWYEPKILFRDCFFCFEASYYKKVFINIIICANSAGIYYIVFKNLPKNGWSIWFLKAILLFGAVNIQYFLLYRNKTEFLYLKSIFVKKIIKKG